jgi:hypothetical protein
MTDDGDGSSGWLSPSVLKFVSQGSSEESDQSSNFTAYDIWCAGLSPETFPLIGSDIEPYRRLLGHSNHLFGQYDVQSFEGTNCAGEVLEARDGLSRHFEPQSLYVPHTANGSPMSCNHPRGIV